MKVQVLNIKGEKLKEIDLPESIYGVEMNEPVLHTVVKAQLANKRQGTHATKTRSMVSGSGKKPFRQKGTGGARQGCSRSPLMPGGATAHGPQPRDYTQKLNRKVKNLAMRVALSDKLRHQRLIVVDDFAIQKYSTKQILASLAVCKAGKNTLIADERKDDFLYKSTRNIHGAEVVNSTNMNVVDILGHECLMMSETALKALQQRIERSSV
jgi:large subunit ribosomal protein L4